MELKQYVTAIKRKICVVGLGYIGLPTATILANSGHDVVGIDLDTNIVEKTNSGIAHFAETGLGEMLKNSWQNGCLRAQADPEDADVFVICVPTPIRHDKSADLRFLEAAFRSIAPYVSPKNLIIVESTVSVGATRAMGDLLRSLRPDLVDEEKSKYYLAFCPERVLPGKILHELVNNDRIIGGETIKAAQAAEALYRNFCEGEIRLGSLEVAEMVKLAENAYRDVNIAFANELANACDTLAVDVWQVIEGANQHPRVNILRPGVGVGGHCIAVDPWFIVSSVPTETQLLRAAREVNDNRPTRVTEQILSIAQSVGAMSILCLGVTYKENVDDVRGSPAMQIVNALASSTDLLVKVCDPLLTERPSELHSMAEWQTAGITNADTKLIVKLVNHAAFSNYDSKLESGQIFHNACGKS